MNSMFCNYCGKCIQDDAKLCAYCGRVVVGATACKRLERPRHDRKFGGVCAAFGRYFDIDVAVMRILWILAVIMTVPLAIIAYFAAWIVIPEEPEYMMVAQQVPAPQQQA
jgi:phage shock protein PspC (stress-responsive transcriptional regulator)